MLPVFINLLRRLYFMRASRESAAYHSLPKEGISMDQSRAPIMEALENFKDMRIVPFDVPGHKRGRGSPELTKFLGHFWLSCACASSAAQGPPASRRARSPARPCP